MHVGNALIYAMYIVHKTLQYELEHDIMIMHVNMMNMFIMFMFYAHVFTALFEQCSEHVCSVLV